MKRYEAWSPDHLKRRILIIGGVAAGASAATRARRIDPRAEIVVFERSGHVSFANCGLPYYVGNIIKERDELLLQTPQKFKDHFDIDVRIHHEVEFIDRERRGVRVKNLETGIHTWEPYDRLILAPGASPIIPPFKGIDSVNVFLLRTMEDTDKFRSYMDEHEVRRAVVVGAGFIGLEVTEALAHRGASIELAPQVLTPLDADMAAAVAVHLREKDVTLHLGTGVRDFETRQDRVVEVTLNDGRSIEADLVVLSVGVRPETRLAQDAGLEIGPNGGIKVNERLETSDPAILAAGDAIEVIHSATGQPVIIPLAGPANKHGRLAGELAAADHGPTAPRVAGTAIVKVFDLTVAVTGLNRRTAKRAGIAAEHVVVNRGHHVGYYPGAERMTIKLVYEPKTRRVLGAQIVGGAGVDRRIDLVATVIHFGGTVDDLEALDLAYAPQYGAAKDPVHIAAFVASNQDRGLVRHADPADVPTLGGEGYQIVDVRDAEEFAAGSIPGAVNISVEDLRSRAVELHPEAPILVFCEVGQRGYYASRILSGLGRNDVVNLAGGYLAYETQQRAAADPVPV